MTDIAGELPVDALKATPSQEIIHAGSRYLFADAAKAFGVHLDSQENDDWRTLLMLGYVIDELVDVDRRQDIGQQLRAVLAGDSFQYGPPELPARFRAYMAAQTDTRQAEILARLDQVSGFVDAQANSTTVDELVAVQAQEAQLFAQVLSLPVEDRPDAAQRNRFNQWLQGFSRVGYLFDTLVDLQQDYEDGSSSVRPTFRAKAAIGRITIKESLAAVRKTPPRLLGKVAVVGLKYQFLGKRPNLSNPATKL